MANSSKREPKKRFDGLLLIAMIALSLLGIAMIGSTVGLSYAARQTLALLIGCAALFVVKKIPNRFYSRFGWGFFLFNLVLLGLTLYSGFGREETGGQSWLTLGPIRFQPAEIVKITFILAFAAHLDRVRDNINRFLVLLPLLLHLGLILGLILLQPDFGTACSFLFIAVIMLYTAGLGYGWLLAGGGIACLSLPVLWFLLQDYQQERILTFLDPERDPYGAGYQVLKSIQAFQNGGLKGEGFLNGSLTQMDLLPAKHTDFIFSATGEELGFLGCVVIIALLFVIVLRCLIAARASKTSFGMLSRIGIAAMLLFHSFENIGMCIGLIPVTGIPLPFVSYGGTALITVFAAMGLVFNDDTPS